MTDRELTDEQWLSLIDMLRDYPRLREMLKTSEHRKWLILLIKQMAKYTIAVGTAAAMLQTGWGYLAKWLAR